MIYLDASVALAHLTVEPRRPSDTFWSAAFCSSRLLQFEIWNRLHARRATGADFAAADRLVRGLQTIEMTAGILERARDPFPVPARTLDALHLATMHFLRAQGEQLELASYDDRLITAARALDFPIAAL